MRRAIVLSLIVILATPAAASAGSPAFGKQRKRATAPAPRVAPPPVAAPTPPARADPARVAVSSTLFPRPASIEARVRFWTRVYSEIETHEGFIHDNRDLAIVYDVVRWPKGLSERQASARYEVAKRQYRSVLLRLAERPHDALSAEERRVLALFPKGVSRTRLEQAAEGVRFQRGQADKFRAGLIRSGQWTPFIRKVLQERGLPLELAALPHVESSFDPTARSHAGAGGLWQFMPSTARMFKLRVDHVMDERFDPWRATEGAAALLADNHRVTGTWPLALIAYNHGPGGPLRAIRELGTREIGVILSRYEGPSFGFASRNFYPSFLAALEVDRNQVLHFGPLRRLPTLDHEAVVTDGFYSARAIAKTFGVDLGLLRDLNLGLREPVWKGRQLVPKGVTLRLPRVDGRAPAAQLLASIAQERRAEQVSGRTHIVERGDTISRIARRYGVSARALASANGIRNPRALPVGRRLRIPGAVEAAIVADSASRRPPAKAAVAKTYTVRRGDTLSSIARRHGTSVRQLLAANNIERADRIRAGQKLRVPATGG
ncbi:LysM peptidoglycan-binding domain-containing protein [Myxococcota bacterium]|nr:LysM peptidoglycan-binding domain-containing protein [Myxococcota bacterium]MCZ7620042.1 LysM peptidoglycan-binding domain-containing protein [Myxococcota bacterium]